jgi:hypothetical protein
MPVIRGKGSYYGGFPIVTDSVTGEVTTNSSPIFFYDDFMGAGHLAIPTTASAGSNWCSKIVKTAGTVTVSAIVNTGFLSHITDATSEKQDAVLYCADQRAYTVNQGLQYETRMQLGVIPTAGTKAVAGVAAAWADGPNNIAQYLRFAVNGNGTILCESQDGSTQLSVSTGITVTTTTEAHILRIDATDVTNVMFFVDGAQVCASTTFPFAATGANAQVQPYSSVYKASGTSVGTLNLDYVAIWQNRQ